jgi:hypothetical protein
MMPTATALMDDVTKAMLCMTAIDACCVIQRGALQCEAGRLTALNELSCHGLYFYQDAEDAKVAVAAATSGIVFREAVSSNPVVGVTLLLETKYYECGRYNLKYFTISCFLRAYSRFHSVGLQIP